MTKRLFAVILFCLVLSGFLAFSGNVSSAVHPALAEETTPLPDIASTPTPAAIIETPPLLETTSILDDPDAKRPLPPSYDTPLQLRPEDHYWFARPLPSSIADNRLNLDYKYGSDYNGDMKTHTGADIAAPMGTPVLAVADGVVAWAGYGLFGHYGSIDDPYGKAVSILHDFGYLEKELYSAYAHMSEISVKAGDRVKKGQQIGLVGMTGKATGPHLHFEVRLGEDSFFSTRNPELWLVPPEGYGVLAGRIESVDYVTLTEFPIWVKRLKNNRDYVFNTYKFDLAHPDDIYKESFALNDLPAGEYVMDFWLWWRHYVINFEILPGMTTFILVHSGYDAVVNPPIAMPTQAIP